MSKWKSTVLLKWVRHGALGCTLLATSAASAQIPRIDSAEFPEGAPKAKYTQSSYNYQPVPQPEIPVHAPEYPGPTLAQQPAAPEAPAEEEEEGPWTIQSYFDQRTCNRWKDNGWTFGGWTQIGYQDHPDGAFNGNSVFLDDRTEWNRVNLNQQWFYLGKAADGSKGFDWGFRVDAIYGVDGNDTQAFGNPPGTYDFLNGWDHGSYEWALPQLYAEMAYESLSVKVGHFFTPIGYEVVPSNGNFFLSRQLTFYNSEPFTHTGALASYKASDELTFMTGWVAGMDTGFRQFNGSSAYIGGFTRQLDDKTTLAYAGMIGNLGWRGDGSINSAILSRSWTDKFSTVHQFDVLKSNLVNGANVKTDFATDGIAGDSIGFINYAFYQMTDKVKGGVRYEWYKPDGTSYNVATVGVNYFPTKNLVIRPELRHMWSPGNHNVYNGYTGLFNQNVLGIDAILTY